MSDTRMCLNCGLTVPASHDRAMPGPNCPSPDACTFDITLDEAWIYWRGKYHQTRAELDRAEARVAKLEAFVSDFAEFKFDPISRRAQDPQDDLDPLTEYLPVEAWQDDARAALADKGGE